ncbi:MAG TPA: hypothetical protein VN643_25000 [Pyrinomonadaceae bacterium]|nr:hypothetical protein [Pyrinomonadaceae bacterium]
MRAFKFHAGEVENASIKTLIVDLHSVVSLKEQLSDAGRDYERTHWVVTLSSGEHLFVTKPAFDRILREWNARAS